MNSASWTPQLPPKHVHFVGIGGIGMSGLAKVMRKLGYAVSGSDAKASRTLEELFREKVLCHVGHAEEYLREADLVVISSAVSDENPEVVAARRQGIPVISRAQMLGYLMNSGRGIAIAGTHGKTTTTALISYLLTEAGLDPTALVGGEVAALGGNARLGMGDFFVAEADESDGSLTQLNPELAVITNIDSDHLDHYHGSMEELERTFARFLSKVPADGAIYLAVDDPRCLTLSRFFARQVITFGLDHPADYMAVDLRQGSFATTFTVTERGASLGQFRLNRPGRFNVANALAAIAIARRAGIPLETIRQILPAFQGVKRRFDILHNTSDLIVVDDYAHHPNEIRATLGAARANHADRIIGIFQPHRYSRVQSLHADFGQSFQGADEVIVTDIYAAGESPLPGVDIKLILDSLQRCPGQPPVRYIPLLTEIPDYVRAQHQRGDLVITLGAGDVRQVAEALAASVA